jgi:hypothetical protein
MRLLKILMAFAIVLVAVDLGFNDGDLLHALSVSVKAAALDFRRAADGIIDSFFRR